MKRTKKLLSILLTLMLLLNLLPAPASAAEFIGRDTISSVAITVDRPIAGKPLADCVPKTTLCDITCTWSVRGPKGVTEVPATTLAKAGTTYYLTMVLTPKVDLYTFAASVTGTVNGNTVTVERMSNTRVACMVSFTPVTYTVTVNGGSGSGEYGVGDEVTITATVSDGKAFKEWTSEDGVTFADPTASTTTFTMPAKDVELTATYQRVKPDTTVIRPAGSGTEDDPFKISTVGELYWFAGFTNNYVAVNDTFDVERNKAHAILMNDITVNPDLLTDSYGLGVEASLLASWSPISYREPYCGTVDGNGHTISGLYYYETSSFQTFAFIAEMGEGGVIKDLTLEDTYFYPELNSYSSTDMPCAAGIVGIAGEGTVENCHFDGVVGAGSTSYYGGGAGGIAWSTRGVIQNCTAKGRVIGQASFDDNAGGAKVGGIVGAAYGTAVVSDCINDAEVTCWDNDTAWGSAGGIVGYLAGTVRDCRNRGVISGRENNYAGGIVGRAAGEADQYAVISRCWNEANFTGSGIVDYIHSEINGEGYTIVKNCYNAGSVTNGIVGKGWGDGISIAYCHNWGTVADAPIYKVKYVGDTTVVENCFYRDIAETDSMDGTTFKTTEEFASSLGFVTKMLNAGNNGNWKQGGDYPILNKMFTLTVNGGTGSGVYGVGTEVTVTADVPVGYLFAGWNGLDGLSAADTVKTTFIMPERDLTLTAQFISITPVRPAGDGSPENPFEISTLPELLWFQGYVNYEIEDSAMYIVQPFKACAKLMNDITVNHQLLNDEGGTRGGTKLEWTPISKEYVYKGTFDGQGYSISGLYHDMGVNSTAVNLETTYHLGLFGVLGDGGIIRDLTVKDSYLSALYDQSSAYTGGIVAEIDAGGTVKNCHFDGIVTAPYEDNSTYLLGGIAAVNRGDIRNCTSKGLITGYFYYGGGIVGDMVQGTVTDCVNEATVKTLVSGTGRNSNCSGGIVGTMATGTVRDCCNKGDVSGSNSGGIVGIAGWAYREGATILRCWNKGTVESGAGIAHSISGDNATIKNCYNAGSVRFGIVNSYTGDGHSVTYCHNVGKLTAGFDNGAPIISTADTDIEIANCYYLTDSEQDEIDGTTAMTAEEFADGTVLALLNADDNAGNWKQGDGYPVLAQVYTVTVNGGTGSGTYDAGAAVTITATVPDGKKFVSWSGTDGLTFTFGSKTSVTATFTMPAKDVELTAVFGDIYTLNISSGYVVSGAAGAKAEGEEITVAASPAPYGKGFDKWTVYKLGGDEPVELDVISNSLTSSVMTFRMPAESIQLTATYKDAYYPCYIEGGTIVTESTNGGYKPGTEVVIRPDAPPEGKIFSHWESSPTVRFNGENVFLMSECTVQIWAVYVDAALRMDAWCDYTEVSGGYSEAVSVQVEHLNTVEGLDPTTGAMLVVAQYSCNDDDYGKMTNVHLCSVKEDGTYVTPTYVCGEEERFEYRVFLLDGKTREPLYDWLVTGGA